MSDNSYDQRVRLHGGSNVHGAMNSGDITAYPHTACNLTVISVDTSLSPSTEVTCKPCDRVMKGEQ